MNHGKKSIIRNPYLWGALAGILILPVIRMAAMARRSAPPPILEAKEWSLISLKSGLPVSSGSLKGRIVLAHLQSSRCGAPCQTNSAAFAEVMKRFHQEAQQTVFLTLWVGDGEPQHSTTEVAQVAQKYGLTWHLLKGEPDQWRSFIFDVMAERSPNAEVLQTSSAPGKLLQERLEGLAALGQILLFDQNGALRAKVDGGSAHLAGLVRASLFLLEKGPE